MGQWQEKDRRMGQWQEKDRRMGQWQEKDRRMGQWQEKDRTDRATGLSRRTRKETVKWNQMRTPRFRHPVYVPSWNNQAKGQRPKARSLTWKKEEVFKPSFRHVWLTRLQATKARQRKPDRTKQERNNRSMPDSHADNLSYTFSRGCNIQSLLT